jgi:hypothetical protein
MSGITLPNDAVGQSFEFVTNTVMVDPRGGGAGLVSYAGEVVSFDGFTVLIREKGTNDEVWVPLANLNCMRRASKLAVPPRTRLVS